MKELETIKTYALEKIRNEISKMTKNDEILSIINKNIKIETLEYE